MKESDSNWHLTQSQHELKVTEFELQLWRVFNGFLRWVETCEKMVNNSKLNGHELSILHIIRMKERPKSIGEIGRILNRSDNFNLQYSIKKLLNLGLIEKIEESPQYSKSTLYNITDAGIKNTDAYTQARRRILIDMFIKDASLTLPQMTKTISQLKTIYDEAEQAATFYLNAPQDESYKTKTKQKRKKILSK